MITSTALIPATYNPLANFEWHQFNELIALLMSKVRTSDTTDHSAKLLERAHYYESTQPSYADDLRSAAFNLTA